MKTQKVKAITGYITGIILILLADLFILLSGYLAISGSILGPIIWFVIGAWCIIIGGLLIGAYFQQ